MSALDEILGEPWYEELRMTRAMDRQLKLREHIFGKEKEKKHEKRIGKCAKGSVGRTTASDV